MNVCAFRSPDGSVTVTEGTSSFDPDDVTRTLATFDLQVSGGGGTPSVPADSKTYGFQNDGTTTSAVEVVEVTPLGFFSLPADDFLLDVDTVSDINTATMNQMSANLPASFARLNGSGI